MQHLQDDNSFDHLSRDAADQFEPDQQLHSWEKLLPHVEAALPQEKERKRRFIILFFFLLIGGGLAYSFLWKSSRHANTPPLAVEQSAGQPATQDKLPQASGTGKTTLPTPPAGQAQVNNPETSDENPAPATNNNDHTTAPGTGTQTQATANKDQGTPAGGPVANPSTAAGKPPASSAPGKETPGNTAANQRTHNNKDREAKQRNDAPVAGSRNTAAGKKQPATKNNDLAGQPFASTINGKENKHPLPGNAEPRKTPGGNTATDTAVGDAALSKDDEVKQAANPPAPETRKQDMTQAGDTIANTATADSLQANKPGPDKVIIDTTVTAVAPPATATNKRGKPSRWEFSLGYAPDVSTVKFTHTQKPGRNFGLMIGYNINKRFAVQTGLIYTSKNYKSKGEDYHPPKDYWTSYYKIETVTASCDMWDIPINLRYNLAPRKRSNLFISTGLSSYLMRQEDYSFFYYYNGMPVTRERTLDTDAKDWFSVLNLSLGYEHRLSSKFSVQAEPFFKQPLRGVGFGNVKLNTTGIFLSVKYRPR